MIMIMIVWPLAILTQWNFTFSSCSSGRTLSHIWKSVTWKSDSYHFIADADGVGADADADYIDWQSDDSFDIIISLLKLLMCSLICWCWSYCEWFITLPWIGIIILMLILMLMLMMWNMLMLMMLMLTVKWFATFPWIDIIGVAPVLCAHLSEHLMIWKIMRLGTFWKTS